jgi:hypothetical protein
VDFPREIEPYEFPPMRPRDIAALLRERKPEIPEKFLAPSLPSSQEN